MGKLPNHLRQISVVLGEAESVRVEVIEHVVGQHVFKHGRLAA